MATLPADRSKLALAQSNQVPGNVASSTRNINAITELYDTTDLLNAKVNGMVSAGTLSALGVLNVKDFGASGSSFSTTGSITQGTNRVLLADKGDFAVGQGISVEGLHEVAQLVVSNGASASSDVTVTLNGVAKTVAVTSGDTADGVATKIRAATYPGWTTGGSGTTVTFTSNGSGVKTDASYSAGTTGATGTMSTTTQGTDDLVAQITDVNGNNVTLSVASSIQLVNALIRHEDTSAVQKAMDAAGNAGGGIVMLPRNSICTVGPLVVPSNIIITGGGTLRFRNSPESEALLLLEMVQNVVIDGITLDINSLGQSIWTEYRHAITIYGAHDVTVRNCSLINLIGDGMYITHNGDFTIPYALNIHDNQFVGDNYNRNGLSIIHCRDSMIHHNYFYKMGRNGMPGAIDLEPNNSSEVISGLVITDNIIVGGGTPDVQNGISLNNDNNATSVNILIANNSIRGPFKYGIAAFGRR